MKKKGYRKPKIEKVKLAAEEAVLQSCKSQHIAGPGQPVGFGCLFIVTQIERCFFIGS